MSEATTATMQHQPPAQAGTDRIERQIVIDAPRQRVWAALTTPEQFGAWFGCELQGQAFRPGQRVRGLNTACGHEGVYFDATIQRMEAPRLFSWRWTPFPIPPSPAYDDEEPTLVEFTLDDAPGGGTLLRVVESGFDKVPPHRRLNAFRMHEGGWKAQLENIARHVTTH